MAVSKDLFCYNKSPLLWIHIRAPWILEAPMYFLAMSYLVLRNGNYIRAFGLNLRKTDVEPERGRFMGYWPLEMGLRSGSMLVFPECSLLSPSLVFLSWSWILGRIPFLVQEKVKKGTCQIR